MRKDRGMVRPEFCLVSPHPSHPHFPEPMGASSCTFIQPCFLLPSITAPSPPGIKLPLKHSPWGNNRLGYSILAQTFCETVGGTMDLCLWYLQINTHRKEEVVSPSGFYFIVVILSILIIATASLFQCFLKDFVFPDHIKVFQKLILIIVTVLKDSINQML